MEYDCLSNLTHMLAWATPPKAIVGFFVALPVIADIKVLAVSVGKHFAATGEGRLNHHIDRIATFFYH